MVCMAKAKDKQRINSYKFDNALNSVIGNLKSEGRTNTEIAELLNVSYQTFAKWVKQSLELSTVIAQGRDSAVDAVEANLFRRAMGFYHPETKVFCNEGEIITHTYQKFIPGDVGAMAFLLKNMRPSQWRDRPDGVDPSERNTINLGFQPKSKRYAAEQEQPDDDGTGPNTEPDDDDLSFLD